MKHPIGDVEKALAEAEFRFEGKIKLTTLNFTFSVVPMYTIGEHIDNWCPWQQF